MPTAACALHLAAAPQMVPYTVTDQDKLASTAIVWVPGLDAQYPVLANNEVIKVQAGETAIAKLRRLRQGPRRAARRGSPRRTRSR